jgi:predicted metal-dependent hydrolase
MIKAMGLVAKEERQIKYKIIYSGRRSLAISIGPAYGVIVRAPFRTSLKAIENLVGSKTGWINKHLESYRSSVNINNIKDYDDGAETLLYGRMHRIKITASDQNNVQLDGDDTIKVGLKNLSDKEIVGQMLEKWYKFIAEGLFRRRFNEILLKYKDFNFRPSGFSVKVLKRRWGSCSSKGMITVSSELVKLDDIYLEYVILHELCHLRHHNHGKEFYNLLTEVFPEWKKRRSELRRYVR